MSNALIALLLGLVIVAIAASDPYYTAAEARKRYEQAIADRAPLEAMVRLVTAHVRGKTSSDVDCTRVPFAGGGWDDIPELVALREYPDWKIALRHELEKLGYKVKDVLGTRRQKTCDCARPPEGWDGLTGYARCAMACFDGPGVELCW